MPMTLASMPKVIMQPEKRLRQPLTNASKNSMNFRGDGLGTSVWQVFMANWWVRNRLRYCIWKHWKKLERRRKNLIRLGVDPDHAYQWSRTRMGGWAVAQSPILITTITLDRLSKRGYMAMLTYYEKIAPSRYFGKPLYTRSVRTVVVCCESETDLQMAMRYE